MPESLLVQKYGGSSVGSPDKIRAVATRIVRSRAERNRVVVVVSAMADTTDELIKLAGRVTSRPHERELDMLLTAGERISMALLSMALRDLGVEAISFTGSQAGILTDESHTRARILEIRPTRVREELERGRVVIVAGFQGVSRTKEITTLGRGGSDTTAVALAAALGAGRCEVFTDVPGILSADPRVVPGARRYRALPLGLAAEMAALGAQVMHPRSLEIARAAGFPIFVGETVSGEGTMLIANRESEGLELPKVTAVTARNGLKWLRFEAASAPEVLAELTREAVLVHSLSLDFSGELAFLVDPVESAPLLARYPTHVRPEAVSTVSLIGYQLQQNAAVPGRLLEVLAGLGVVPGGLTCHPQSITVWFSEHDSSPVVRALHERLVVSQT